MKTQNASVTIDSLPIAAAVAADGAKENSHALNGEPSITFRVDGVTLKVGIAALQKRIDDTNARIQASVVKVASGAKVSRSKGISRDYAYVNAKPQNAREKDDRAFMAALSTLVPLL